MAGWGDFVGKIAQQFQGRIERAKNERIKLQAELDRMPARSTDETAKRESWINNRIKEIDAILATKASD